MKSNLNLCWCRKSRQNCCAIESRLEDSAIVSVTLLKDSLRDVPWAQKYCSIYHVKFECGLEGVFRPYKDTQNTKNFDSTVFAYVLSRNLGFNVVPPAVERSLSLPKRCSNEKVKGSLQLFISPDTWTVESQKYSNYENSISDAERNNVETFQYITGLCDRHKGNRIIDKNGNVALVDVGDMCTPKMIIPGEWEYLLVGSFEPTPNIKGVPNFEDQPTFKIFCPSRKDLRILMKPFVSRKRLDFFVDTWMRRLGFCGKENERLEYIIWRNCLWVKHTRKTYLPIHNVSPSSEVIANLKSLEIENVLIWSANESSRLICEIILYRVQKVLSNEKGSSKPVLKSINFPMLDLFRSLAINKKSFEVLLLRLSELKDLSKSNQIEAHKELENLKEKYLDGQKTIKTLSEKVLNLNEKIITQKDSLESFSAGFHKAQETVRRLKDIQDQQDKTICHKTLSPSPHAAPAFMNLPATLSALLARAVRSRDS